MLEAPPRRGLGMENLIPSSESRRRLISLSRTQPLRSSKKHKKWSPPAGKGRDPPRLHGPKNTWDEVYWCQRQRQQETGGTLARGWVRAEEPCSVPNRHLYHVEIQYNIPKQLIPTISIILTCTHAISSKDHPNMREKKFPLLFDLIHTYHLMEGSLNMHGKSFPLYYATYIPKIFFNPIMKYNI